MLLIGLIFVRSILHFVRQVSLLMELKVRGNEFSCGEALCLFSYFVRFVVISSFRGGGRDPSLSDARCDACRRITALRVDSGHERVAARVSEDWWDDELTWDPRSAGRYVSHLGHRVGAVDCSDSIRAGRWAIAGLTGAACQ